MAATCFNHAAGTHAIPGTGNLSPDPIMVCKLCGALNCAQHGQRDPNVPECVGAECDPALLVASAAATTPAGGAAQAMVRTLGVEPAPAFATLGEFLVRRPRYQGWLADAVARERADPAYRFGHPLWTAVPPDGQDMLLAAHVLTRELQIPQSLVHPAVRDVFAEAF